MSSSFGYALELHITEMRKCRIKRFPELSVLSKNLSKKWWDLCRKYDILAPSFNQGLKNRTERKEITHIIFIVVLIPFIYY